MLKFMETFLTAGDCFNKLTQATGVSVQYSVNDPISIYWGQGCTSKFNEDGLRRLPMFGYSV